MDFTIKAYEKLLSSLQGKGYAFQTFEEFIRAPKEKSIVLRHDVDKLPGNSLRFAKIQAEAGIKGTYYFRAVPESWDENIIREIASLGHEIGYHYETMDSAYSKLKVESSKLKALDNNEHYGKLVDLAYEEFCINLERLRNLSPVNTICMHGSPRSKYDNKELWSKYDYKSLGIIGEPYFDVDFNKVLYLTDTGRRWDGWKVSIRDKVPQQKDWNRIGLVFHSTYDIIKAIDSGKLLSAHIEPRRSGVSFGASSGVEKPSSIMFTFHPQRWHSKPILWMKELVLQNTKNQVKRFIIRR